MAAVHDLLEALSAAGVSIEAHGDGLRYRPASAMTPDLLGAVKTCKAELLELLKSPGGPGAGSDDSFAQEPIPARAAPVEPEYSTAEPLSKADAEFDRFERVAKPMPGGGLYCPVYGSPTMPSGIPGERWDEFIHDCGGLGRGVWA